MTTASDFFRRRPPPERHTLIVREIDQAVGRVILEATEQALAQQVPATAAPTAATVVQQETARVQDEARIQNEIRQLRRQAQEQVREWNLRETWDPWVTLGRGWLREDNTPSTPANPVTRTAQVVPLSPTEGFRISSSDMGERRAVTVTFSDFEFQRDSEATIERVIASVERYLRQYLRDRLGPAPAGDSGRTQEGVRGPQGESRGDRSGVGGPAPTPR